MDPTAAGRAARALDLLHALYYFAPEADAELTAIGVPGGWGTYFGSRSAAMGAVGPGTVAATFFVFNHELVSSVVPSIWATVSPDEVVAARFRAVDASFRRLFGDDVVTAPETAEAAAVIRAGVARCDPSGRPLFAAHADLPWPEEAHVALWHGITLLREYRGDGHVAALVNHGLTGLEALVTHTATGTGYTREAARTMRGWSENDWDASVASLASRGLMTADGLLSPAGATLRAAIEESTDRSAVAPWAAMGEGARVRLAQVCDPLLAKVADAGAFPGGVFARHDGAKSGSRRELGRPVTTPRSDAAGSRG